jgi:hypothetical protein
MSIMIRLWESGSMNEFELVSYMKNNFGVDATVFHLVDNRMTRVQTTIVDPSTGNSAIGTFIDVASPIYNSIITSGVWEGIYPLFKIYGYYKYVKVSEGVVLFCGKPFLNKNIESYLLAVDVGGYGYFFIITDDGITVMHPNNKMIGENISFLIPDNITGFYSYEWNDELKTSYLSDLQNVNWRLGFGINNKDLDFGVGKTLLIISGCLFILSFISISFLVYGLRVWIQRIFTHTIEDVIEFK